MKESYKITTTRCTFNYSPPKGFSYMSISSLVRNYYIEIVKLKVKTVIYYVRTVLEGLFLIN